MEHEALLARLRRYLPYLGIYAADVREAINEIESQANLAERLRWDISRLNMRCEAMGWMLYPHSDPPREAVAGDIGWPT